MKSWSAAKISRHWGVSDAWRVYVILLLGVGGFGFSAIFARAADAPGLIVAVWRVSVAALLLAVPFAWQPPALRRLDRATLRRGLLGGTIFAISVASFHIGLDYTPAANAAFLANIAPVWVGLITLLVLRQALPRRFWPGVSVALAGAALIVFGGGGLTGLQAGDLIVLANSLIWATYQVYTAQSRIHTGALTWVWLIVTVSALWLIPLALLLGYRLAPYSRETTLNMLGAGVVAQAGGFLAFNYVLGRLPAARVSVVNLLQPVVTAIGAALLLGEAFGGWRLAGGALILAGVYLVTMPDRARGSET